MDFCKLKTLNILVFCLLFLSSIYPIYSQEKKADLEVTTQPSSETVRGGETFSYTVTVKNIGDVKAIDVIAIAETKSVTNFIANSSSKGVCKNYDEPRYVTELYCKLGDLEVGESVIILLEVEVQEFGDISNTELSESEKKYVDSMFRIMGKTKSEKSVSKKQVIGNIQVAPMYNDKNEKNNSADVLVELIPSKNIPPRLEILTQISNQNIKIHSDELDEFIFEVKAFDPDGEIKKVFIKKDVPFTVRTEKVFSQSRQATIEKRVAYYIIEGKEFREEEIYENYEKFRKYFELDLIKTGKDTYQQKITYLKYGTNRIVVEAQDNGGRDIFRSVSFNVIGDTETEIISPKNGQAFTPNSTIKVTTKSQVNDSSFNQIKLTGMDGNYPLRDLDSIKSLKQTKRVGNILEHEYVWKNVPVGIYGLEVVITNDKGVETNASERVLVGVVEPSFVDIISIKDGQEFEEYEEIEIIVTVTDKNGKPRQGNLELFIDGKSKGETGSGNLLPYLTKGKHTIQVASNTREYGFLKGKSKPITITIK